MEAPALAKGIKAVTTALVSDNLVWVDDEPLPDGIAASPPPPYLEETIADDDLIGLALAQYILFHWKTFGLTRKTTGDALMMALNLLNQSPCRCAITGHSITWLSDLVMIGLTQADHHCLYTFLPKAYRAMTPQTKERAWECVAQRLECLLQSRKSLLTLVSPQPVAPVPAPLTSSLDDLLARAPRPGVTSNTVYSQTAPTSLGDHDRMRQAHMIAPAVGNEWLTPPVHYMLQHDDFQARCHDEEMEADARRAVEQALYRTRMMSTPTRRADPHYFLTIAVREHLRQYHVDHMCAERRLGGEAMNEWGYHVSLAISRDGLHYLSLSYVCEDTK